MMTYAEFLLAIQSVKEESSSETKSVLALPSADLKEPEESSSDEEQDLIIL